MKAPTAETVFRNKSNISLKHREQHESPEATTKAQELTMNCCGARVCRGAFVLEYTACPHMEVETCREGPRPF